jgi:hypothetical protein
METLNDISHPFNGKKRPKVDGSMSRTSTTYIEDSKTCDITYFQAIVEENPPSRPENLPRLKGMEEALFYSYDDDMMFMNEGFYMILISQGFKFNNELFALLVLGSIYDFIGKDGIDKNAELKACFEYYQNLDVIIKGEKELITQSQSFVHYMYDTESYNQQPYQEAFENIPSIISSFRTNNGKKLFPKFSYDII